MTSATAIDEDARRILSRLERREAERSGVPLGLARQRLASKLELAPGMLENIRRGRTKGVRGWILDRLHQAWAKQIHQEIAALEHELEMLRLRNPSPLGEKQIVEVEEGVAALARRLEGLKQ